MTERTNITSKVTLFKDGKHTIAGYDADTNELFDMYDGKTIETTRSVPAEVDGETKPDFYVAAPWFRPGQMERLLAMHKILDFYNFSYFAPHLDGIDLPLNATEEDRDRTFQDNIDGITNARAVLAITDGLDTGTIWEAGMAYGANVPVQFFAETLGDHPFNVMLAKSAENVFLDFNSVSRFLAFDETSAYEGTIR